MRSVARCGCHVMHAPVYDVASLLLSILYALLSTFAFPPYTSHAPTATLSVPSTIHIHYPHTYHRHCMHIVSLHPSLPPFLLPLHPRSPTHIRTSIHTYILVTTRPSVVLSSTFPPHVSNNLWGRFVWLRFADFRKTHDACNVLGLRRQSV